jgi:hypothetical protein
MGNYIKKEYSGNIQKSNDIKIVEKVVEKDVDISELAQAMAKALVNHLPQINQSPLQVQSDQNKYTKSTFDESKTLEKIANSMLVDREEKESNIENVNKNTIEIKKDNKETSSTIDLLSNLDD